MGFSDYLERGILSEIFGIETKCPPKWIKPAKYYIGLCKEEVNDDDTGCTIKEPHPSTGYERVENRYWGFAQLDLGPETFIPGELAPNKLSVTPTEQCPCDSAESTEIQNTQEVIFPKAKGTWGEIVYVAILDAKTNGNLLAYGKLSEPVEILDGEIFKFTLGDLIIGIQGGMNNTEAQKQLGVEIRSKSKLIINVGYESSSSMMSESSSSAEPTPTPTSTNAPTPSPTPTPTPSLLLFDSSSWSSIPEPYKSYLTSAADRWLQFICYNSNVTSAIQQLNEGWVGLKLNNYAEENSDIPMIASCGPYQYIDLEEGGPGVQFNAVSFNLTVNLFYASILDEQDWINVLTHELGHALGIGTFWDSILAPLGAVAPSNYFLDGSAYSNAQDAYNSITESSRSKVPLESSGGSGTSSAHWEDNYRPSSATGSGGVDYYGLGNELMIGSYAPGSTRLISDLSIKSLVDFGYQEVSPGTNEGVPTTNSSQVIATSNTIKLNCKTKHFLRKIGKVNVKTGKYYKI